MARRDHLTEAEKCLGCRPGTADSDINVLALAVEVPFWVLYDLIVEVKKHRNANG